MRTWNLSASDPLCLTLAADARLGKIDYANDQIWNVNWQSGAPPALAVETTFGLRARSFRIFPRFSEADIPCIDPVEFYRQPTVQQAFPNYIALSCMPFPEIDVFYEIWVPSSQTLAGRITFTNHTSQSRSIRLDLAAQLTPNEGERMASIELEAASVLSGATADLSPIVFMTGGSRPGSGSFPSLRQEINLEAGQSKAIIWTHAALSDPVTSFTAARQLAFRQWDAEIARLEMINAGTLEFFTGNPDWDATFKWAQKQALSLIINPEQGLPYPSLVQSRQPDQGYSPRGDGSDYSHLWNGQNPFSVYSLSNILIPFAPEIVKGLIRNFIAVQAEDGFIDFKPGIAQQRSRKLATPLLANLTWQVYQVSRDRPFLEEVYPALENFIRSWFSEKNDRDQDGIPEWDHPIQSGYEDHPLFAGWLEGSQGIAIHCAESPSLIAFLIRELDALTQMTKELNLDSSSNDYEALSKRLTQALLECWDEEQKIFFERDRDAHTSDPAEFLGNRQGSGAIEIHRQFPKPARLAIKITPHDASLRHPRLVIHGTSSSGERRVEELTSEYFRWWAGKGHLTGERIYLTIEQVDIENLAPEDLVEVYKAGFQSMTIPQLLPIWTGQLAADLASALVNETLTSPERFWQPFGLPACINNGPMPIDNEFCTSCDPLWNTFIIEGLHNSGYTRLAAELFTRLMSATVLSLKTDHGFRHYFHAQTGQGIGEINSLNGIPPVGLFLKLLGIQIHSPTDLIICGENPFPWPITVKYRGLTILRGKEKTNVIFPDGQAIELKDPVSQAISLEMH